MNVFPALGVAAAAIIYGTDVFAAVVLRPAAARARDASVADLLGHVHHYGDRRLPVPGVVAILAAAAALLTADGAVRTAGAATALVCLLLWLVVYASISAPVNRRLRAAAAAGTVPPDVRSLQRRWDSVIWPRVALQALALAGLLVALVGAA